MYSAFLVGSHGRVVLRAFYIPFLLHGGQNTPQANSHNCNHSQLQLQAFHKKCTLLKLTNVVKHTREIIGLFTGLHHK